MPNILLVDDKKANLIALEALLETCGAEIFTASSGNEALAMVLEQKFSLVLLDVQMPGMDGYEVAELMRCNPVTESIPIIFVTAISKEQRHVFKGYESGAVDYMFKPLDPDILQSKVSVFLQLGQKTNDLEYANERLQGEIELRKQAEEDKDRLIADLKIALAEVKTLRGIVPICSKCQKLRNDAGYWQKVDHYLSEKTDAIVSHGLCQGCMDDLYGGQEWYDKTQGPTKKPREINE